MEEDIHKLADWLEQVTHEGIAIERKILAGKAEEEKPGLNLSMKSP